MHEYKDKLDILNSDQMLHFIIRETNIEKSFGNPDIAFLEMIFKKAALFASKTVIVGRRRLLEGGYIQGEPFEGIKEGISGKLKEIYDKYSELPKFKDTYFLIPEGITYNHYDYDEVEHEDLNSSDVLFNFFSEYQNKYGVKLSFSDPILNKNLFEFKGVNSDDISVHSLWLPHLTNIPLDVLIKLREDEGASFLRFQMAIKHLLKGLDDMDSETKLKELFERVHDEVRAFEFEMKILSKSRALRTYNVFINFSVIGLCTWLSSPIAQVIAAVFGAYQGKEFLRYLFRELEIKNEIRTREFYLPWVVHKH
jgi:hypothetical protein